MKRVSILTLYILKIIYVSRFLIFFITLDWQNVYDEHSRMRCIDSKNLKYCWQINLFTRLYFLRFVYYIKLSKIFKTTILCLEDITSFDHYIAICVINKCNIKPHLFAFWYLRRIWLFVLYLIPIYSICKFYYIVEENINNHIYTFFVSKSLRWLYV